MEILLLRGCCTGYQSSPRKKESSGAAAVQRPNFLRVLDLLFDVPLPALVAAERLLAPASQEASFVRNLFFF
jgi:hypothetical protein